MSVLPYNSLSGHLTQLYTETKKSALVNVPRNDRDDSTPALSSLHRKFRIQKDRLITWGLEWSDEGKGPDGNIDGSVARAGLTETVTSVLENIKEVLEQAERIRTASISTRPAAGFGWVAPPEKAPWLSVDISRYRDLVTDLTTSIDILYDLSRTRRALAAGSHPSFTTDSTRSFPDEKSGLFPSTSFASSEQTLVSHHSKSSPPRYLGLPPIIDQAALILPEEGPPPYQNAGVPLTTRMIGRLLRSQAPEEVRLALQESFDDPLVLVEFAHFDTYFQKSQAAPPLRRLEAYTAYLQQAKARPQLNLVGYFEDPNIPRYGLVFDLSELVTDHAPGSEQESEPVETYSLLHLLQSASKSAKSQESLSATPPLEDRFKLALRIAERMEDLHALEVMHGNITSDSVAFVTGGEHTKQKAGKLRTPVLDSFDLFARYQADQQAPAQDFNLYRHPADTTVDYDQAPGAKFDIYGLGLVLLEIGLWTPLSDLHKARYGLADFKERLERIWIPRLGVKCGSLYMSTVQACFNFSDGQDVPASRLHQMNLARLRRCCLLCDETSLSESRPTSFIAPLARSSAHHSGNASRYDSTKSIDTIASLASDTKLDLTPTLSPQVMGGDERPSPGVGKGVAPAARELPPASSPFREYRQRVVTIQKHWRARREQRVLAHRYADTKTEHGLDHTDEPVLPLSKSRAFPVNLPPHQLAEWHNNLGLQVSKIVERALKGSLESSTIDLVALGPDEASARPTILITCTSTAKVKAAIRRKLQCDTNLFDVKVRKGALSLSRRSGRAGAQGDVRRSSARDDERASRYGSEWGSDEEEIEPQNPYYHPRPSCGASIGAYNEDEGHLSPVSFGGIVLVDDKPYGMTVHHMLEPGSDVEDNDSDDDGETSSVDYGSDADSEATSSAFESDLDSDSDDSVPELVPSTGSAMYRPGVRRSSARAPSIKTPLPISSRQRPFITKQPPPPRRNPPVAGTAGRHAGDAEDDGFSSSSDVDFDAADDSDVFSEPEDTDNESLPDPIPLPEGPIASEGDTRGFSPSAPSTRAWVITQPAMLDAQKTGYHPPEQDQEQTDEDHLLSFELGALYASSGLRRYRDAQGWVHEIDWALFEVKAERLQACNLVLGGRTLCAPGFRAPGRRPRVVGPVLRNPGIGSGLVTDDGDDEGRSGEAARRSSARAPGVPGPGVDQPQVVVKRKPVPSTAAGDSGPPVPAKASAAQQQRAQPLYPAAQDLFPSSVLPVEHYPSAPVLCSGRTSGLGSGTVGPGLSFVKMRGRRTFSASWTVVGGTFGVGGDSGAWVVDARFGAVVGHVVAERGGVTYFSPFALVLDDVRRVTGRRIELPGHGEGRGGEWREREERERIEREKMQWRESGDVEAGDDGYGGATEVGVLEDGVERVQLSSARPSAVVPDRRAKKLEKRAVRNEAREARRDERKGKGLLS